MNVIVDDRDSAVQYIPHWRTSNLGRPIEFDSTTSNPGKTGDAAQFSFTGTSVAVYGSLGPGDGSSMGFSVDGAPSTSFLTPSGNFSAHHQPFFVSPTLPDGAHTLQITSTGADVSQLFVDYFIVRTTEVEGKQVFLDDSDKDVGIVYGPGWGATTSESYFQQTIHVAEQPAAWVAVTFQGTLLTLHGPYTTGPNGETFSASAIIDGDTNTPVSLVPPTGAAAQPSTTTFNNLLFSSPALSQGTHTVNITFAGGQPLFVDYFLISTGATSGSGSGSANGNAAFDSAAAGAATATGSKQAGSSSVPLGGSSSRGSGLNVGAIAGGVIAGLLLLLLLAAGLFLCRRRRQARKLSPSKRILRPSRH
ncbi:hypothetical protein C8F01DRAFT_509295 [Mycena amicta]|nr:hypothetical protein C8F01DRAFT_509295 [Mycena amicta]